MSLEVLFLCHRLPYPPNKGDKIRSHALLTHLAKRHRVHVACFIDDPADFAYADTVRAIAGGECLFVPLNAATKWFRAAMALLKGHPITTAYFGSAAIKQWVTDLTRRQRIDRAVVFSSAMAPYILDDSGFDPAHAILDMVDIDSDKWRQYAAAARGLEHWIFRREAAKLFRLERAAARRFGATILVSPYEARSFAAMAPESASRIFALSNGVDLDRFAPGEFPNPFAAAEIPIVMTGRMDYRANVDGVEWFAKEVMPLVARELPAARFHVVGSNPTASLRALAGPLVSVSGQVDDVRPYIRHAAVVVAPLRIARGIQNKVLEAMAMAMPVVTTREASQGLDATPGDNLWVENEPARFAAAVVAAASGQDRVRVGLNARKYVERYHDWGRNLSVLDELLADACPDEKVPQPATLRRAAPSGNIRTAGRRG